METKISLEEACTRVLAQMKRASQVTLVGHVANEQNCSLAEAETILMALVQAGRIRRVTPAEMLARDIHDGFLLV